VLFDFRFPPRDAALRERLEAELTQAGPGVLYERLRRADPATAERVDPRNGRRVVRALEVLEQGQQTHGASLPDEPEWWRPATVIGLAMPRAELIPRLDERVERMWSSGLVAEVDALRGHGIEQGTTAGRAIGYAQALAQLDGQLTEQDAIAQTQALTRRYARRQVSWFRRYRGVRWLTSGQDGPIEAILER
jgi:tRNA dimethylallyltransferase